MMQHGTDIAPDTGQESDLATSTGGRRTHDEPMLQVRSSDLEPYTGLRYLSKLFRIMAIILVLLLIAEIVTGFYVQGRAAIPTLLGQASRLLVLAGLLWGTGDLAMLLIDVGHDVRAARILIGRQAVHPVSEHHGEQRLDGGPGAARTP